MSQLLHNSSLRPKARGEFKRCVAAIAPAQAELDAE